jgi:cytochrome b
MTHKIRIWDLPTRLFHWALVLCVIGLFITGKVGGDAMRWHFWLGYAVLALVLFRVIWGFIGGYWSRFARFFPTPARLSRYLRGQARPEDKAGHNPLGAGSVLALLLLMAAQAGTGLFAWDEISNAGPLSGLVPSDTVSLLTGLHAQWGQYLILGFVSLHVIAIAIYTACKHSLVWPMIVGDKPLDADLPPARDTLGARLLALIVLAAMAGAVYALVTWGNAQGTAGFGY